MDLNSLFTNYWHKAVETEQRLHVPAAYILAHAAIETDNSQHYASKYIHGFDILVVNNTSKFKKFFIDIYNIIKNFLKPKKTESPRFPVDHLEEPILEFFDRLDYHNKFNQIQSISKFAEYIYKGKKDEEKLTIDFKIMVENILQLIHS